MDETANYCYSLFFHRAPPKLSSFPFTTPDATEMRAGPETAISTRATPRLIGASTVVLPLASVLEKLTTVPSGTKFPLQSRTGSVSTDIPFDPGTALILRLQASEATCCTTRISATSPIEAPTFAGPPFRADVMRIQAVPFAVVLDCDIAAPSGGITLKSTFCGDRTRLWNLSNTKATALMAFDAATGTLDGWTN